MQNHLNLNRDEMRSPLLTPDSLGGGVDADPDVNA